MLTSTLPLITKLEKSCNKREAVGTAAHGADNNIQHLFVSPFPPFPQASAHPAGSGQGQPWQLCRRQQAHGLSEGPRWSGSVRAAQQTGAGEIQRVCQGKVEREAESSVWDECTRQMSKRASCVFLFSFS